MNRREADALAALATAQTGLPADVLPHARDEWRVVVRDRHRDESFSDPFDYARWRRSGGVADAEEPAEKAGWLAPAGHLFSLAVSALLRALSFAVGASTVTSGDLSDVQSHSADGYIMYVAQRNQIDSNPSHPQDRVRD